MNCHSSRAVTALSIALLASACTMTSSIGYDDGWVSSSPVSYSFTGPPLLSNVEGQSYRVRAHGDDAPYPAAPLQAFDRHGMRATNGHAAYKVDMQLGDVRQGEPGAMQLGSSWYPAFSVSVPYNIRITDPDGSTIAEQDGTWDNVLTFQQLQSFDSREDAVNAIDAIRQLARKSITERARKSAWTEASKTAQHVADGLFDERHVSVEVPVVRSAAGVDLEACYQMLTVAETPEQVQRALEAYQRIGTNHRNQDGTPNDTANYGVACGIAACQLMLRDLTGAWKTGDLACKFEPQGQEIGQIRSVIFKQEQMTGVKVIPQRDRERIQAAQGVSNALEQLMGATPR